MFEHPFEPFAPTHYKTINLTGGVFDRLTVYSIYGRDRSRSVLWLCRCSCGNWSVVKANNLRSGHSQSCGCMSREIARQKAQTHGFCSRGNRTPEYAAYQAAQQRCRNPKTHNFERYGGRGIEFRFTSFEQFFAELGMRPSTSHSLNRIHNDGHYEPGNVEWATRIEQVRNRGYTRLVNIGGESKYVADWCAEFHIDVSTVYRRVDRGMSWTDAITKPSRNRRSPPKFLA